MPLTLHLRNFRGLRRVDWELEPGVSLLVGPNGSGKTTLLSALVFLAQVFAGGFSTALRASGAAGALRHFDAEGDEPVCLGLDLGELKWRVELGVQGPTVHPNPGETLGRGDTVLVHRALYAETFSLDTRDFQPRKEIRIEDRSCLRFVADNGLYPGLEELSALFGQLRGLRYYFGFWPAELRNAQGDADTSALLHSRGRNLYSVLRNWMSAPRRFDEQFTWVVDELRRAFPGQFKDLEFDTVGRLVDARFFVPGRSAVEDSLPLVAAADGLLVGLALLTAIAGAAPGSVMVIDELENHLHPHAIRSILTALRERAEARQLRVILSTHSPVVMDAFRDEPEALHVLEPGRTPVPVPLTDLHDADWLLNFALGDLYVRQAFAAQSSTG